MLRFLCRPAGGRRGVRGCDVPTSGPSHLPFFLALNSRTSSYLLPTQGLSRQVFLGLRVCTGGPCGQNPSQRSPPSLHPITLPHT